MGSGQREFDPNYCSLCLNCIMLCVGITVLVISAVMFEDQEKYADLRVVTGIGIACGVFIILSSFYACIATHYETECTLRTFIVLMVITLILEIVIIICIMEAAGDVATYARIEWDALSEEEKAAYEQKNNCCYFEGEYHGFKGGGCYGCNRQLKLEMQERLTAIGLSGVAVMLYQSLLLCMTCNRLK
eukprot:CAMPEP_0197073068 /NCGR_PEP_ID=MMETSP1384-20130603/210417_1 /TAXON_ID=29189 /ORGANISM="Ammonia sp." /LENGTH=187 /DNA_ID=CAMNT_0042511893 /DNA_START=82 /DNA_END=645 /DNA_ORIENTATION=-